jgi:AbrB family looped-hinge helix DNA binding protein
MPLVTVKNKYQVVIPARVRAEAGIEIGDLLEAKVERGKVTLTPKSIIDRRLDEALENARKRRTYGPYNSVHEAVRALHKLVRERAKGRR